MSDTSSQPIGAETQNTIQGPTTKSEGHVEFDWHDRKIIMHPISEHELTVLEVVKGNAETTWLGVAIGAAITFFVVIRTTHNLSSDNSALFHDAFWFSIVAVVYFANRARTARTLVKRTIAEVRKRKEGMIQNESEATNSLWERCKGIIKRRRVQNP